MNLFMQGRQIIHSSRLRPPRESVFEVTNWDRTPEMQVALNDWIADGDRVSLIAVEKAKRARRLRRAQDQ
jgi:hypothetical protein